MPNNVLSVDDQKKQAARFAVNDLVEKGILRSGMRIGLGTGSTAMPAVHRIAELIGEGRLSGLLAVPTSFQTTIACEELGIPVYSLNSREIGGNLDLAIDGADEVDPDNNLIKGGGAASSSAKERFPVYWRFLQASRQPLPVRNWASRCIHSIHGRSAEILTSP